MMLYFTSKLTSIIKNTDNEIMRIIDVTVVVMILELT